MVVPNKENGREDNSKDNFFFFFCSLKICEKMNSLAFKAASNDNFNEKRKTNDSSKTELRVSCQKEEKTLEKKKSTKEGDIKSFKGKVFKAQTSESSEAETSESSGVETSESMKGQFTKSLEGKDCKPSKKEISESSREDASRFSMEQLCPARDTKSMEGEANVAKDMESPTEEDNDSLRKILSEFSGEDAIQFSEGQLCLSKASKSTDREANEAKSTESQEKDSASSQDGSEFSEGFTSDFSDVNTSVENAMSISEGETFSSNGTSDGMSYEGDSRSSKGLSCSDRSDASTSENRSKSPSRNKGSFRCKISKLFGKVSRGMKGAFKCCLLPKQED